MKIEAALTEVFGHELRQSAEAIAGLVETAQDQDSFRQALRALTGGIARLTAEIGFRRTHTLALTASRPALARTIAPLPSWCRRLGLAALLTGHHPSRLATTAGPPCTST